MYDPSGIDIARLEHRGMTAWLAVGSPAMVIHEMTEEECRRMLAATRVARLACARDHQPYVVPIRAYLVGNALYGYSTLGQKIEWMRQNPLVCLEIDDIAGPGTWTSVVVFGRYEELPETPSHQSDRNVALRAFQEEPMWWEPAAVPPDGHPPRPRIVYRIHISRISGRRAQLKAVDLDEHAMTGAWRPQWLGRLLERATGKR